MKLGEFRKLTADLPDNTYLLADAGGYKYRESSARVTTAVGHICAFPSHFEKDEGDDPKIYGHVNVGAVRKARRKVVVIE